MEIKNSTTVNQTKRGSDLTVHRTKNELAQATDNNTRNNELAQQKLVLRHRRRVAGEPDHEAGAKRDDRAQ